VEVITLDGRRYARFLAAGAYFIKKYRAVVNDLNVYPVPDGDTGTNMYLTVRSAAQEAYRIRQSTLSAVSAAAAEGALMGARGNSGVILSQMLRGFAHHVRHRVDADTFIVATAMRESALAARQSLLKPTEGTILSVADAAADAAYRIALHENDFLRFLSGTLKAANEALDATPQQLPALAEAGVVDAGGAGFVYLLEGALMFLPEVRGRATAFPRRPDRSQVFSSKQNVGERRFCTEFVLEQATCTAAELRRLLEPRGESLLVVGGPPTIRVHVHTDDPERVKGLAARCGVPTRIKVDDMEHQHSLLLVDGNARARSVVAVVPGPGFAAIAHELGADIVVPAVESPSVRELLLATNKSLSDRVYLFVNDGNVIASAEEAAKRSAKDVVVVPTRNIVEGIAGLLAMGSSAAPGLAELTAAASRARGAQLFFAAKDTTLGGATVAKGKPAALVAGTLLAAETLQDVARAAVTRMRGNNENGLVTLYYGGTQREKDAQRLCEDLKTAFGGTDVEYYYGGMKNVEYWIAFDE
jgi:DAK2 domain fusion protein YloV